MRQRVLVRVGREQRRERPGEAAERIAAVVGSHHSPGCKPDCNRQVAGRMRHTGRRLVGHIRCRLVAGRTGHTGGSRRIVETAVQGRKSLPPAGKRQHRGGKKELEPGGAIVRCSGSRLRFAWRVHLPRNRESG